VNPPDQPTLQRELDVVVHGATGFVGRLVAAYLAEHAPIGVRIGLSGRSIQRLEAVRRALGPAVSDWPLIVADAADPVSLAALAERTRVVATTVGPYAKHGLPLVRACAQAGTHYADLTGEVLFVRDSIDAFDVLARSTGARIVHSCGFDSVPSDLAVLLAARAAAADGEGTLTDTSLVCVGKGGFSGGTIDSMRTQVDVAATDRSLRRVVVDPYALSPDRSAEPDLGDERDRVEVFRSDDLGGWVGPFVMASFNTRIVRRSNALSGWAYGRSFRYRELMGFGRGPAAPVLARAATLGLGALLGAMQRPRLRPVVDRLLPSPGEGPDAKTRAAGFFRVRVSTTTTTGARYLSTVAAQGDPGYAATSVMLGESALALADGRDLPPAAGVLTPASGIGAVLAERLTARGFTADVRRLPAA
jgi:short subunit dehydrogenase-like uncharacterized protein